MQAENYHSNRGLFYSQPLLGVGQLVRSFNICKSLVQSFDVDFLLGSPKLITSLSLPRFYLHHLPPLWIQEWTVPPQIVDPEGKKSLYEVFEERKRYILTLLDKQEYDFVIIELYPFSKWMFEKEIELIIREVKKKQPHCLIVCSARDIAGRKDLEEEKYVVEKVNTLFDCVFVHADPSITRLDDSFSLAPSIANKIVYTGYVTDPSQMFNLKKERKKQIIVSNGGGAYGGELPFAVTLAAFFLPDWQFRLVLGPKTLPVVLADIKETITALNLKNCTLEQFRTDFSSLLEESMLSVSLGGSTVIEAISTQTRALIYPYAHVEHVLRVKKLAERGAIKILERGELHPIKLSDAIKAALEAPYPTLNIDLSGSTKTAKEILKRINL